MQPASPSPRQIEIIGQPLTPAIRRLAAYWQQARGGAFAPSRHAVDPAALKPELPHLFMLDVIDGGADFRYRLVGTEVAAFSGRDVTGKTFGELYGEQPEVLAQARAVFVRVLETRAPVYARGQVFWLAERGYRDYEGGYFPLSRDGAAIDIILCLVSFTPTPA